MKSKPRSTFYKSTLNSVKVYYFSLLRFYMVEQIFILASEKSKLNTHLCI